MTTPKTIVATYGECLRLDHFPIVSEANRSGHWAKHHARHRLQRSLVAQHCRRNWDKARVVEQAPLVVHLVRIGGRRMDDDNLASAFKHVRDGVADFIGIDDGSDRVRYTYYQRKLSVRGEKPGIAIHLRKAEP